MTHSRRVRQLTGTVVKEHEEVLVGMETSTEGGRQGGRPVTLFTGQWRDVSLADLAEKAHGWGYDGLEVACCEEHLDVARVLESPEYCSAVAEVLMRNELQCLAVSAHEIGQAVCDRIDDRHQKLLPQDVWGDGDPAKVWQRASAKMMDVARAAAQIGVTQVNGFTGSAIWHLLYGYPPHDSSVVDRGYEEFAERWGPIMDVFRQEGVRFGLEVCPAQIAYDFVTTEKTLDAIDHREEFGINFDPSHLVYQGLDPEIYVLDFAARIYHVHIKDARVRHDGRRSILGSHLKGGDPRRGWNYAAAGHGSVDFDAVFRGLNSIGYRGPLSSECEEARIDREWCARDALAYVRRMDFPPAPGWVLP